MAKFHGDVRPLSNNPAYMGVVFSGSMSNAIKQAKAAPDHGLADQVVPAGMSRNRAALLQHLNLLDASPAVGIDVSAIKRLSSKWETPDGFYTLEYAMKHWPQNFVLP